jgi:hypothetical protein
MARETDGGDGPDLVDVLLHQDVVIAEAFARNAEHERYVDGWLVPTIARRRAEFDRLNRKLEALQSNQRREREIADQIGQLRADLQSARAESDALRRSMSWRLTAPLRSLVAWFPRFRGRQ